MLQSKLLSSNGNYVHISTYFLIIKMVPSSLYQFSHSVVSNSLWPHGLQHARLPRPSPSPGACSHSCPLSRWCHPSISSFVVPFSRLQSFPASGSFPVSHFFTSGGQSIGVSVKPGMLQSTGSQRVRHDWATELNCGILVPWPGIKSILSCSGSSKS